MCWQWWPLWQLGDPISSNSWWIRHWYWQNIRNTRENIILWSTESFLFLEHRLLEALTTMHYIFEAALLQYITICAITFHPICTKFGSKTQNTQILRSTTTLWRHFRCVTFYISNRCINTTVLIQSLLYWVRELQASFIIPLKTRSKPEPDRP